MGFQPTLEPEAQGLVSEMQAVQNVRDQLATARTEQFQAKNLALEYISSPVNGIMSHVVTPLAKRAFIPERVQEGAREARKLAYRELKSRIPSGEGEGIGTTLKNVMQNGWNFITNNEANNVLSRAEHLKQYREAVKEITSVPDYMMNKIRNVSKIKEAAGNFGDGEMGLANTFGPGVILHEAAGHNATETVSHLVARGQRHPELLARLKSLPANQQETLKSQFIMEQMDMAHIRLNKSPTASFYKKNYGRWPSEIYSNGIESTLKKWVDMNKARPTYFQYIDEVAEEPAKRGIETMKRKFPKEYKTGEELWNRYYKNRD